jgi:hypothetical protein
MSVWFHSAILATGLAATVAIGIAGASIYRDTRSDVGIKENRLTVLAEPAGDTITVETRVPGGSILHRVPVK